MRGSPLIRTLIVLIALVVAGFGLNTLGSRRETHRGLQPPPQTELEPDPKSINTPFVLTLSAPAKRIILESLGQIHTFDVNSQTISGTVPLELGHPTLFIDIEWADSKPAPRFAKLVLEPAGFPTMTKVFDSTGNLSDVWELHLHHDEHE